ncbi:MAG: glycoside hydrolase family 5 protein [Oscillospiraceae bacterium]|nr:glycoside hydrolase family 5 protein [Oscillospiraceae bacterium]
MPFADMDGIIILLINNLKEKSNLRKAAAVFISALIILLTLAGCSDSSPVEDPIMTAPPTAEPPEVTPEPTPDPGISDHLFKDITAAELVASIRVGWSLGNTFDAHSLTWLGDNPTVSAMETGWQPDITRKENIDALRAAGFNAIRIPVTWIKATDENYTIREDWMARIKEVVDWAVANDMVIILNSHHCEYFFSMRDVDLERTKEYYTRLWEQIATEFKDYNEKLIFEGLNEPRTRGSSAEWSGGTAEEHNNVNILNQNFVDTVRRTGGFNDKRILLIPTYAASATETAQKALVMPTDTVPDKIIVSIHSYAPWEFALRTGHDRPIEWSADNTNDTRPITEPLDTAYDLFVSQGIPVIMGEMGAINRNNLESRVAWAEFYTSYAKSKGIPCFWWDPNMSYVTKQQEWGWEETFGIFNRSTNVFDHPEIVDALMRGTE